MSYTVEQLSQVAAILDQNDVRHVLGFHVNLELWGVGLGMGDLFEFIIHDEHFSTAVDLIANAGFTPCTDKDCRVLQPNYPPAQIPEAHFHFAYRGQATFAAYKKSKIYWALPDFPIQHPSPEDGVFMLSNDPRLPPENGRDLPGWPSDLYPAKILTPLALMETFIHLCCRDVYHYNELFDIWFAYINRATEYAKVHWIETKDLQPRFRRFWDLVHSDPVPGENSGLEIQEEIAKQRRAMLDSMPPPQDTRRWSDPRSIEMYEKYGSGTLSKYWP